MKLFQKISYLFALIILSVGASSSGNSSSVNKTADETILDSNQLKGKTFSLSGIVDDSRSNPFACSFGRFTVSHLVEIGNRKEFKLDGEGILINSASLDGTVGSNNKITYSVPKQKNVKNGTVLSAYCNGKGRSYSAPVEYFVTEK